MNVYNHPIQSKAAMTYNAAADHYDMEALGFWARHGRRTVELLDLTPGLRVLDVGCGTGASALPAAQAVGPTGRVIGIDLAGNMLDKARRKAKARGLDHAVFELADMTASGFPDHKFDAVVSVFSIFFVEDMERQLAELWRMVRPGGALALTSWGTRAFQPAARIFSEEVRRVKPDLPAAARPWERLIEDEQMIRLFIDAGATAPEVYTLTDVQPLKSPDDWWTIAMGSGFRWEIDQLTPDQKRDVRDKAARRLQDAGITAVEMNALSAIAEKPRSAYTS